jgi:hypothetical protein
MSTSLELFTMEKQILTEATKVALGLSQIDERIALVATILVFCNAVRSHPAVEHNKETFALLKYFDELAKEITDTDLIAEVALSVLPSNQHEVS